MLVILTPIPAAPGYFADILNGHIWSARAKNGQKKGVKRLVGFKNKKGYRLHTLMIGGKAVARAAHRMIAEAAHGPCQSGMECRHLNGDVRDNRAENLCWGSAQENRRDQVLHGTVAIGERHGNSKLSDDAVREIRRLRADGQTLKAIGERYGVTKFAVHAVIAGKTWRHVRSDEAEGAA